MSREWLRSRNGNPYLNIERHNVGVSKSYGKWMYWIRDPYGDFVGDSGEYDYDTEDDAKLALFEQLAELLNW